MVDGEPAVLFRSAFFQIRCALAMFSLGSLQDVVVVVPEEAELFVAGFFLLEPVGRQ